MTIRYRTDTIPDLQGAIAARAAVGTVSKSGVALADGVLSGYAWSGNSITYSFPVSRADYGYGGEKNHGFAPVNAQVQDAARRTLDLDFGNSANDGFSVEGLTNLTVSKGDDQSDIRYAESSSANPTAYAYYPTGGQIGGDVWIGKAAIYDKPAVGTYGFATILHETGHALGLKHGHDATSYDRIKTVLHGKYDSLEYSVMTYHSYAGQKGAGGYTNEHAGFPQTYMMADIRALQHMYGADFSTNSGNTVYSWSPKSGRTEVDGAVGIDPTGHRIFATIWDGGGKDTYDLSAYRKAVSIDLRPGESSLFSKSQLADLDSFGRGHDASGNIYNALLYQGDTRSLIENAIGGAGNDHLRGNIADNTLTGNAGNDQFIYRTGSGQDTITDFSTGDRVNLVGMGISFAQIQALGSDSGSSFVINFGNGDTLTLQHVSEASLTAADFML
jgi:serralysin